MSMLHTVGVEKVSTREVGWVGRNKSDVARAIFTRSIFSGSNTHIRKNLIEQQHHRSAGR
jgi:hypothetical protein